MDRLVLCVLLCAVLVKGYSCPGRCICQHLSPTLTLLCAKTGLLFVPPSIDRKTVELRLTDNFITIIRRKDFFNMTSLVHLTLSRNTISQITPHAFVGLRSLRALHMDGNRLSSTSSTLAVSFGGNPLHCNCELLWLRRLTREDDLETCASPEHLMDKYFWSIQEEEFICEPPLITKHLVSKPYVMEGQGVTLKCKAVGDPDPDIHWRSPDGKLVHNNSRTILYDNGTLDILITTLKDSGAFNCVASNAAGIATAAVEINMIPLPLFVNNTGHMREDPGLSDITTSSKSGNDTKGYDKQDRRVMVNELTSSSAVIRWPSERHIPGIRMYQIQYNSTADDTLVYSSPEDSKTKVSSSMHSQTNGSQQRLQRSTSKQPSDEGQREPEAPKECMALVLRMDNEKKEDPAATTAILEVELPPLTVDKMKRRTSLDAQCSGPPSEDTQTDSSLTGSTMSLCLIGPNAGTNEAPRLKDKKSALANMGLLPNELARTRHRFSFDGGDYSIFQSHSYPRRARTRWHKSTNQLNVESSPLANRRVTFSSTEWMLESTV
ncbi:leucine-rich repeat and fibronectin type III domain-containing protein 1 [Scomber scombrus]|uniref:Leucine-rich repeat and fibronectin type III domain-containing protein 1 n=1 Tax=Scomber scombrus TaxID=13677 RepID=A0AAV1P8U1_SCOSC